MIQIEKIIFCQINLIVKYFIIISQMMIDEQRMLDQMGALIKIIKQQEAIFFQVLNFTCKNIQSSSNEIDQISIFNNFVMNITQKENLILEKENQLLNTVGPNQQLQTHGYLVPNTSKQMMRLSARIFQTLQSSIQRTRKSIFNQNGRMTIDFARFKKNLHKIIQQNPIQLFQFAKVIIGFCRNKFRRQITKINNYLKKLKDGQHVTLREMYSKDGSDASVSPDQKITKRDSQSLIKDLDENDGQSPKKKPSLKRPQASKAKRPVHSKSTKKQKEAQAMKSKLKNQKQFKLEKSVTAAHILKVYSIMQIHKKDFLQDFVFQRNQQQKQRKRLITQLMERNKANAQQIKSYYSKCQNYDPAIHFVPNPSSDDNKSPPRNDSSVNSKISIKTSFLISKRKQSFTFQGPPERSDIQVVVKNQIPFSRTIRNLSTKKRNSQHKNLKNSNKSKKIFIVKSPLNFDDDMIPKANITYTGWVQASLTGRDRNKRGQNIRLKKRSNPCPMDQKFLPESYRINQHQL